MHPTGYSYTFSNIAITNVIFTKGASGPQTVDIIGVSKNTCYIPTGTNTKLDVLETDCSTLGIDQANINSAQIKLYPNPVSSVFKINVEAAELYIYDMSGKMVKQFKGSFKKDSNFDISNLAKGMYFVKAKSVDGLVSTLKLVKE